MLNKESNTIRIITECDRVVQRKEVDKAGVTQDFFLRMSQRNFIKRTLSPIKTTRDFKFKKDKTDKHYNFYINSLKADIIQVDELIHKHSDLIAVYYKSGSHANNSAFQQRLAQLHANKNISINNYFMNIIENSQSLEHLYKDFECRSKEDLIIRLSLENYFMQLFFNKLNDLIILISLKYYNWNNEYVQGYSDSLSKFHNLKFLLTKISEHNIIKEESSLFRKESIMSNMSRESDASNLLSLNNLSDFLHYETNDPNLTHIKKLIFDSHRNSAKIFHDFIYLHCKDSVTSMKSSEYLFENLIIQRKTIEDEMTTLKTQNEKYKQDASKLNEELNTIKQMELRKYFKDYIDQLDKRHDRFIYDMKNLENTGKDKLLDLLKKKTQKIDELKIMNTSLDEEKKSLNRKIEMLKQESMHDQSSFNEQYETLLQEEYNKMRESFLLKLTNLKNQYNEYKYENIKINTRLNDELIINKEAKLQLLKEFEDMKTNFRLIQSL